jgi:hypothetical protein
MVGRKITNNWPAWSYSLRRTLIRRSDSLAILAAEMGANPGNWIHDREDAARAQGDGVRECSQNSLPDKSNRQRRAGAVFLSWRFRDGRDRPDLAKELRRRRDSK